MAVGKLNTEADLYRFTQTRKILRAAIVGLDTYPEVGANPDAPQSGCTVFCIGDNGAGKRELRARFPTGAVQVIATEP